MIEAGDKDFLYQALLNGKVINISKSQVDELDLIDTANGTHLIHDNQSYQVKVVHCDFQKRKITLSINEQILTVDLRNQTDLTISKMGLDTVKSSKITQLLSPMPGRVLDIMVKEGDSIQAGEHLLILEAMKMENILKATHDTVVKSILVNKGDSVEKNTVLIDFDE